MNPNVLHPPDQWHPDEQMLALSELARGQHVIVEIGTWLGHSALALASTCAGKVYCVDHWAGSASGTGTVDDPLAFYESFLDHMRLAEHGDRIVPLFGESVRIAALFEHKPIDLLHIDGDHRYAAVLDDLHHWLPHVAPGGVVCGDDYGEVKRAVLTVFDKAQVTLFNNRLWQVHL